MSWKAWVSLVTFFLGFVWPQLWIVTAVAFEFGVRHGRDVAAFWAESHLHNRNNR